MSIKLLIRWLIICVFCFDNNIWHSQQLFIDMTSLDLRWSKHVPKLLHWCSNPQKYDSSSLYSKSCSSPEFTRIYARIFALAPAHRLSEWFEQVVKCSETVSLLYPCCPRCFITVELWSSTEPLQDAVVNGLTLSCSWLIEKDPEALHHWPDSAASA